MNDEPLYNVFIRNWYTLDPATRRLLCQPGKRKYLERGVTYAKAREVCDEYARTHKPGKLSRKAEFERCAA